ncbi:MAG: TonB-dependent receptor [Proteobacteria bacterium]|nr:TonB-dependent receptor [Pseudomonadota bacterium]
MKQGHLAALLISALAPAQVMAQPDNQALPFDIQAQDLAAALQRFGVASGRGVVVASKIVAGKRSTAVNGVYAPEEAITRLLVGTSLRFEIVDGAFVIRPIAVAAGDGAAEGSDIVIVVTGTRIRGGVVASPVISLDREQVRNSARGDLGEVVRRLPQSFGGGQNPGIGSNVPLSSGADVGGGSSLNLRGLGSDATLTLLNGHRLAYTAAVQSVDVSAIPLAAVERIEIVPDGASAIYGSDAVAGVANIILRRNFDGLETGARLAATSGGGGFERRYDALAGTTWTGGDIFAAYEFGSNSAIRAGDRSYARERSPGLDLYPAMHHNSFIASGRTELTSGLTLNFDGLYNQRWSTLVQPTLPDGNLDAGRSTFSANDRSWGVAPSLDLRLPGSWQATLLGTYGQERVNFRTVECAQGDCTDFGRNYYRNFARSAEVSATGNLLDLPGGAARLALGGGYRSVGFRRFSEGNPALNTAHRQDSYFGYAEVNLPLVGPDAGLPIARRIDVDMAARYERYPGIGGVLTPKIGAIWAITADVDAKGSWGRSFRAPTQLQQFQPRTAVLYPPGAIGAPDAPANAAAILIVGGNPALKPERATTWSASLDLHPRALPGADLQLTYFDVSYRDRIVNPIPLLTQALGNPLFADYVVRNPSPAAQAAAIAGATSFVNFAGVPYDPATVIAIVDDGYVNAGHQTARGLDVLASYTFAPAAGQQLAVSANLSYLDSDQQLTRSQPVTPLAGVIFNPPHWRGQATVTWSGGPLTLTADANYIGRVRDTRFAPVAAVPGMTSIDVSARYRVEKPGSPFHGLECTASIQNLFNAKPHPIQTTAPLDAPYDSTNYSPIGRLLALEVRKSW